MREGTRLKISVKETKYGENQMLIPVEVLDTIRDVRKVVDNISQTVEHCVVTRYLVVDDKDNVFTIFHNQIKKLIR